MRKNTRIFLCLLALGVVCLGLGCSQPRIDAKDEASFKSSLENMRKSLSAEKRGELDAAIETIFADARKRAKEVGGSMGDYGIMLQLDEMSAGDIIGKGRVIHDGKKEK